MPYHKKKMEPVFDYPVKSGLLPDAFCVPGVRIYLGPFTTEAQDMGVLLVSSKNWTFIPFHLSSSVSSVLSKAGFDMVAIREAIHSTSSTLDWWSVPPSLLSSRLLSSSFGQVSFGEISSENLLIPVKDGASMPNAFVEVQKGFFEESSVSSVPSVPSVPDFLGYCYDVITTNGRIAGAISNGALGVSCGFDRELQLLGVGYTASLFDASGKSVDALAAGSCGSLILDLGKSHKIGFYQGDRASIVLPYPSGPGCKYSAGDVDCGLSVYTVVPSGVSALGGSSGSDAKGAKGAGAKRSGGDKGTNCRVVISGPVKGSVHQLAARVSACCPASVYGGRGISVFGADLVLKAGKKK